MNESVHRELLGKIDRYAPEEPLNGLLKEFVADKAGEGSVWAEITLCVHGMLGGQSPQAERAAAWTEWFMLLLDIVDDLQDEDNPDKPWMKGERAVTLNAVLVMFAASIGDAVEGAGVSATIGTLLARSVQGQQADVTRSVRTEADYFAMVERKSGALLQLAYYMGYALVDGMSEESIAALNELAVCAGIAAQIENDTRDVLRYDTKNDLLQKKRTLPVIYLLEECADECPVLVAFYEERISREEFLRHKLEVLSFIQDSGCVEYGEVVKTLYLDRARELFRSLPTVSPWAERFEELALL